MTPDRRRTVKNARRGRRTRAVAAVPPPTKEQRDGRVHFTPEARARFLRALELGYSVGHAAEVAGVGRSTVYDRREAEPAFAEAWDRAVERGTDRLEDAARRRAIEGIKDPVFYQGKIVGARLVYSDTLLLALLNARRPEKFKWRGEVTTKAEPVDLSRLSDRDLRDLERIRAKLRGQPDATEPDAGERPARGGPESPAAPVH